MLRERDPEMKTITLHLTFSAVVLEPLCSLSQLGEKDNQTSYTHKPKREGRARGGAKGCEVRTPIAWEGRNGPPGSQRGQGAGLSHGGGGHADARRIAVIPTAITAIKTVE